MLVGVTTAIPQPLSGQKAVPSGTTTEVTKAPVYEVVRSLPSDTWERTDVIQDRDELFVQQNFHPRGKHRNKEVIAAFGTDTPHSGDALLHYAGAPPKGAPNREAPVLLIHGANKDGNFFWDPQENGSNQGLAQELRDRGHEVYALTFAHNQDDNFIWTEQVANAIAEIKKQTGSEKVDLVAHSKGAVPARMYVSNVRRDDVEMTPYQGDVRRLVLVGAPNGGVDYTFRHPSANYALMSPSNHPMLNAPPSWDSATYFGLPKNLSEQGYGKDGPDYYPGQRQILANLSERYPLSVFEPDWYTTYHGGRGFVSNSKGIDHHIAEGDNLIQRMAEASIPEEVEVALLAGNKANIPGILNEYTGPSDGLVFVSSALEMPEETNVVAREVLPLHHKALIADKSGQEWISQVLDQSPPPPKSKEELLQQTAQVLSTTQPEHLSQPVSNAPHLLPIF